MYSSARYYGPGGTFLEKEGEYPTLRVSPGVNCNQFAFHTITLPSAGACEVSVLNVAAAARRVCPFLSSLDPGKSKIQQQIKASEPMSVSSEKRVFQVLSHFHLSEIS